MRSSLLMNVYFFILVENREYAICSELLFQNKPTNRVFRILSLSNDACWDWWFLWAVLCCKAVIRWKGILPYLSYTRASAVFLLSALIEENNSYKLLKKIADLVFQKI